VGLSVLATVTGEWNGNIHKWALHAVALLFFVISTVFFCGFATLHAVSRVKDPADRAVWVLLTVGFNVGGSLLYYLTKYQDFRIRGMGGCGWKRRNGKQTLRSFFRATLEDLEAEGSDSKG